MQIIDTIVDLLMATFITRQRRDKYWQQGLHSNFCVFVSLSQYIPPTILPANKLSLSWDWSKHAHARMRAHTHTNTHRMLLCDGKNGRDIFSAMAKVIRKDPENRVFLLHNLILFHNVAEITDFL